GGIGKAHTPSAGMRALEVRKRPGNPRTAIEHDGRLLLVADLHEGGKVAVVAEGQRAVFHELGHSAVGAKDDLPHLTDGGLIRRFLFLEPALDSWARFHEQTTSVRTIAGGRLSAA